MVIRSYILILVLNVNGLDAPTKGNGLTGWIEKKTYMYAISRRPTADLGTLID